MIVQTPNPILTQIAKPVVKVDKKILSVVEEMKKILLETRNPKGVGLAAPQIGRSLRIFVTHPKASGPIDIFINPEIIWRSEELAEIKREDPSAGRQEKTGSQKSEKKLEGCLSINNVWGHLKRPSQVRIRYMDMKGNIQDKKFSGFMATIVQHETDHLNGILFTQRVLEQKDKLYRIETDDDGNEKLVEIEI